MVSCRRCRLVAELAPDVEIIDAGKVPRGTAMPQEHINALLVSRARAGRFVVRLKGGDPFVFGRGAEEVLACLRAGIAVTVVPGVSSAAAGPAAAGVPLTHRGRKRLRPGGRLHAGRRALGGGLARARVIACHAGVLDGYRAFAGHSRYAHATRTIPADPGFRYLGRYPALAAHNDYKTGYRSSRCRPGRPGASGGCGGGRGRDHLRADL